MKINIRADNPFKRKHSVHFYPMIKFLISFERVDRYIAIFITIFGYEYLGLCSKLPTSLYSRFHWRHLSKRYRLSVGLFENSFSIIIRTDRRSIFVRNTTRDYWRIIENIVAFINKGLKVRSK